MELEDLLGDELLEWAQGGSAGTEIDTILTAAIDDYEKVHGGQPSLQPVPEPNHNCSALQVSPLSVQAVIAVLSPL